MLLPLSLFLSLPLLANAALHHRHLSSHSHLALASRRLNTPRADIVAVCPACSTWLATSSHCWQVSTLTDVRACFCTPEVFNTINECIACPDILQFNGWDEFVEDYEGLKYDASWATASCAELEITGLPTINNGSFPVNLSTSSTIFASLTAYDPRTTTASEEFATAELRPTETSSSKPSVSISPGETATSSNRAASSSSSASASVVVNASSSGSNTVGQPVALVVVAGVLGT